MEAAPMADASEENVVLLITKIPRKGCSFASLERGSY